MTNPLRDPQDRRLPRIAGPCGMVLFGVGELIACLVRNIRRGGGNVPAEVWLWVKSAEYVIWFMVYVLATPYVGYLASTVIFMTVLALRLG